MTMQRMKQDDLTENNNLEEKAFSLTEALKGPALNKLHLYKVGFIHGFNTYTWAR